MPDAPPPPIETSFKLDDRPPPIPPSERTGPWVQLKYFSFHPCIYPNMIRDQSRDAKAGQLVQVFDRDGRPFGHGLFNPRARVPLRVYAHGDEPFTEQDLLGRLDQAIELRQRWLSLPEQTDAYRVVHSDGDNLSGLAVDQYGDTLSVECHSLGVFQRLPEWLLHLHRRLQTRKAIVNVDPKIARWEGIAQPGSLSDPVESVRIREHGVRYEVNFEEGHKTGFFCDQRENRRRLATLVEGRRVLDLCCYTGGFALAAKVLGKAEEVTGVDLDEKAITQARRNANLNQARITWVHVDAFSYARQMQRNQQQWDVVVLDPPKLLLSRDEVAEGRKKYEDLNQLALSLVAPGGLFVTCSCSGLLSAEAFEEIVIRSAHRRKRRLQILDQTGAGPDHPILSNCPESRYLKVIWGRVL